LTWTDFFQAECLKKQRGQATLPYLEIIDLD
jgi:hypothetical protein